MNGKGDASRPLSVPPDEYERRWRATFQRTPMTNAPLAELGSVPHTSSHEPDPSGGQNIVT